MLKIQEYLRNNTIEDLKNEFSIIVKQHSEYQDLYLFKYSQIDSPMGEDIVQEARGIILDISLDWSVVCMTYKKFFNYGEGFAADINWNECKVLDKLDGSLIQMYWYAGKWQVATSGVPDALGEISGLNITFRKLFWNVWNELKYNLPVDKNMCYAFELCTPYNKVVVQHKNNSIILHGARNLLTLKEENHLEIALKNKWDFVSCYNMYNLEDIIQSCEEINPIDREGYVVVDNNFNRIKVKSPQYVALSHIKDGCSIRRIVEIIKTNEHEEFITYFPEFEKVYNLAKGLYENLIKELTNKYQELRHIENQKEFALEALKHKASGVLFSMRNGKITTIKDGVNNIMTKNLVQILNIEDVDIFKNA